MRRKVLAAIGVIGMSVTAAACGSSAGGGSGSHGTLTLAPIIAWNHWDPAALTGIANTAGYLQPVYDTVVRLNAQGEPQPNVATKWSYNSSRTALSLTIRSGLKYTDGTALDSAAVKTDLLHTQAGAGEAAAQFGKNITSIDTPSATQLTINLKNADPSLLVNLGGVAGMLASPKAIAAGTLTKTPVGSGPYELSTAGTTAGTQYTFTRNPSYWDKAAYPYDKVVLHYYSDPAAGLNALRSGQVNGGILTSGSQIATAKSAGLKVTVYPTGDIEGVYIWDRAGKISKPLGNPLVRQAINYAFDRAAIVKNVNKGLGTPTDQPMGPSSTGFVQSLNDKYTYDVAKAKQLLAQAGYPNGFTVKIPDLSSLYPGAQAAMTESLAKIGIKSSMVAEPTPDAFVNGVLAGKYAMSYFLSPAGDSWDTIRNRFLPTSFLNPLHYDDPSLQADITKAQASSGAAQTALFQRIETALVDQAYDAPWDDTQIAYASSKNVDVTPQAATTLPPLYGFKPAS